jgi:hypothetical protein
LLEAGFSAVDLTPTLGDRPVYLAGFGFNRRATAVHDPLFARAVVLAHASRKIALVSVDLVGFFYPNVLHVRAELPGFDYVLVTSTHNHEGPDVLGLWGPRPFQSGVDADYLRSVEQRIADAVRAADRARRPVRAVFGSVRAPELLHDSRQPIVKHDELVALEFRSAGDGRPAGVVVQWNCHPETLGDKNTQISADFVGYAVRELERRRGCPAVYLTGTVGGLMSSLGVPIAGPDGRELANGTYAKTQRYGERVAEAAERALADAAPVRLTPLQAHRRVVYPQQDNPIFASYQRLKTLARDGFTWDGGSSRYRLVQPGEAVKPMLLQTEVGYLKLGDLEVAAIPGEIYPELVLGRVEDPPDPGADFPDAKIEPALYGVMRGPRRMLIGLANDEIGYIIPKRQWDVEPPYCYGLAKPQYGEVNSLGPETARVLCEEFAGLVAEANGRR